MNLFTGKKPVSCIWNAWKIGACSKSCGGGSRICTRTKKRQEKHGGICLGKATLRQACNTKKCPSKKSHIYFDNLYILFIFYNYILLYILIIPIILFQKSIANGINGFMENVLKNVVRARGLVHGQNWSLKPMGVLALVSLLQLKDVTLIHVQV